MPEENRFCTSEVTKGISKLSIALFLPHYKNVKWNWIMASEFLNSTPGKEHSVTFMLWQPYLAGQSQT